MQRRNFLKNGLFIGCCAAASPAFSPMAFAAVPGGPAVGGHHLEGRNGRVDVIQPHGDPMLKKLRPNFKIGPAQGAISEPAFSLHPSLPVCVPCGTPRAALRARREHALSG